jgi:hypothetical protein
MSHREFPASVTQATICAYFWAGTAVGVLPFQSAKDWAFSVIEALDAPPIEVIEIATANDRNSAMDALQATACDADQQTAGRWLLADILVQLKAGDILAMEAVRSAMRVVKTTSLPDEVYYDFDGLDDELQLAVNGTYGTLAEIAIDVGKALEKHASTT